MKPSDEIQPEIKPQPQSIVMIQNWDAQLVSRLLQGFMTGTNIACIRAPKIMTATFFASTVMKNAQVQKVV